MTEKPIEYFMIQSLTRTINVEVLGTPRTLPLSWANGMIGVLTVFDSEEKAKAYAQGAPITKIMSAPAEEHYD